MNRRWIESGIVEQLDKRQVRFLENVQSTIIAYYETQQKSLNLTTLARLCQCNHAQALSAIRMLANSIGENESQPFLYYTKTNTKIGYKKRYNIYLNRS